MGRVLFGVLVAALVPICLMIGGMMGYFLLLIMYLALALDFPAAITIGVGMTPSVVGAVSLWWVTTHLSLASGGPQTPRRGTPTET